MTATVERRMSAARGVLTVLFALYLVLLVWGVLWKLHDPFIGSEAARAIKLVPFVRTAEAGSSARWEVIANVLIFVPFGLYLGLLARSLPWWRAAGAIAATSFALEAAQYVLAVGVTDVTDILTNTAGGLAGLLLAAVATRALRNPTGAVVAGLCAIGTVIVVVFVALFMTGPTGAPGRLADSGVGPDRGTTHPRGVMGDGDG